MYTLVFFMSEWTWFTKGLRHPESFRVFPEAVVRMDLIYEGITTAIALAVASAITVRMDLIYEGITT